MQYRKPWKWWVDWTHSNQAQWFKWDSWYTYMKTKFHAASEPIRKLRYLQSEFAQFYTSPDFYKKNIAVLAGGAIRDDYMGKFDEIKDFDIFIHDMTLEPEQVTKIIAKVFPRNDLMDQLFDSDYLTLEEQQDLQGDVKPGSHLHIGDVWEVDEENLTYQLIFTKSAPIEHVNKYFDIGFCKGYCDGKKIRYTDDFLQDVWNKTLTIVGDDMTVEQVEYSVHVHADAIQWKYDDFRVVVPARYQNRGNKTIVTI